MKFSILLPTRNRPEMLQRAVESVFVQTYPEWELVLLDNSDEPDHDACSRDKWGDNRIRYIWLRPRPVANLYNTALEEVTGDIVCHFADDDLLPPHALETVARNIGDADWLVAGTEIRDEVGRPICYRGGTRQALETTLAGSYWLGGAVYWRKTLSDLLGGYRETYDGAADFDLFLRFARHSEPVIIPDVLYLYTDWAGTDSRLRAANQAEQSRRIAQGTK